MESSLFEVNGKIALITGSSRVRGEIIVVAIPKEPRRMDMVAVMFKELTLKGIRVYEPFDFERALRILPRKDLNLGRLLYGPFPLEEAVAAFRAAKEGKGAMRVLFGMD